MGAGLLILHLPCTSPPPKGITTSLNSNSCYLHTRWRAERRCKANGYRNPRPGPGFGFDPEDDRSASSSKTRTWWVDEDYDDGYSVWDEEEEEDDKDAEFPFFKVIRAFGWMLPAIGISLLMGTGPNAFIMALAVPLGQTVLSLVFDKVWGRAGGSATTGRRRKKAPPKKKPFRRASYAAKRGGGTDIKDENKKDQGTGSDKSWMGATGKSGPYMRSDNKGRHQYGGWDELDGVSQGQRVPRGMPKDDTDGPRMRMGRSKLSRTGRVREKPLWIRLMIAVFPFLGSWTRFIL